MNHKIKNRTVSQIATVVVCSLASFGGLASGANLLLNGSFENTQGALNYGNNLPVVPNDWTFTPTGAGGGVPNTIFANGTGTYTDGPNIAQNGNNYMDIDRDGYYFQTVTLASASDVTFGGYFSRRVNNSGGGSVSVWDAANTTFLFSSPAVVVPVTDSIATWVPSFATQNFGAGSYTFRVDIDNQGGTDNVSFEAVPEVTSSLLGMLGLLTFALRRKRF